VNHTSRQIVNLGIRVAGLVCLGYVIQAKAQTTFTRITDPGNPVVHDGGNSRSVNFVDFDSDGYLDIFVGTTDGRSHKSHQFPLQKQWKRHLLSDRGRYNSQGSRIDRWYYLGDYDNDSDPDCFVSTWFGQRDLFFINNGDGSFSRNETSAVVADTGWSDFSAWSDYDGDGNLDLVVANGFSTPLVKFLFHNDGGGVMTRVTSPRSPPTETVLTA